MIHSEFYTNIAAGRHATRRQEADAHRLARQARSQVHTRVRHSVWSAMGQRIGRLRDARAVYLRPIEPSDAALIEDVFARLSPQSRPLRFLTPRKMLTAAELKWLTDVDDDRHVGLIAVRRSDGRAVGEARYIRSNTDAGAAEIAVTVADDWQGRGLGTRLVDRLSALARCRGVSRFTALMSVDNKAAHRLVRRTSAAARVADRDGATVSFEIPLPTGAGGC